MKPSSLFIWLMWLVLCGQSLHADIRVSGLFSDSVVLQRDQPVTIWGWADPGEKIKVEFAGQTKVALADIGGNWKVTLDAMPASPKPCSLVIRGQTTITITDVVVGEVWLASGQSNMALRLAELESAKDEIKHANDPLLRTFCVPERPGERPWLDVNGRWLRWSDLTGAQFSAIGYYFAKRLRKELDVPVGILLCAWGGSGASAWTSPEALRAPALRGLWPEDVLGWRPNIQPSRLYNGMLHPLIPFAVAGVIWYQGETEGEPYMNPYLYRFLFPTMIEDWRHQWQRPELPFFWVQLPNLRNKPTWAIVRESQAEALRLPHTGMIPTIDIGQEDQLHPKNKADFANRLADLVLARQYGKPTWTGAPTFKKFEVEGDAMRLHFLHADEGLRTQDGQQPRGFEVAGEDGRFHEAVGQLDGADMMVRSAAVARPVAVRYAWQATPRVNLVNHEGLPVIPFRTDTLPVAGQEMMPQKLPRKDKLTAPVSGADLVFGKHPEWKPSPLAADSARLQKAGVVRGQPTGICPLIVRDRAVGKLPASPDLNWTFTKDFDPSAGLTVEARLLPHRMAHATRGFDLEVGLKQRDGKVRCYSLTIFPMRLHAFQRNEVRVLGSNLDNCTKPHSYRLAIRADGVAQVYFDQELKGTLAGEVMEKDIPAASFVRVGKTTTEGEWVAVIDQVACDSNGAFEP
jgi:sialate O-acetylesterase